MAGLAVVYSSDCPSSLKRVSADNAFVWQGDGVADDVEINAAINAVAATGQTSSTKPSGGGGSVLLVGNTFNIASPIFMQSWVDLSGVMGRAGCHVKAASGFTGTGMIMTGQTYTEYTGLHDMFIDGNNIGAVHGVYYNSQSTQTPFTGSDPLHTAYNMIIHNSGGSGMYYDTNCRASVARYIRIRSPGGYGLYGAGFVDSAAFRVSSLGAGVDGFYCAGGDSQYIACKSSNSAGHGYSLQAVRQQLVGCHAEDSTLDNYLVAFGKVLLSACVSNSAGLGSVATYDGFSINITPSGGGSNIIMTGCQSYDRNTTPHQRYGVFLAGSFTFSRFQCHTYGNATGSFGGTTTPGTGSVYDVFGS